MGEFKKWYEEKGEKLHIYRDEKWIAKHGFEAGQQSQQAKIDLLEKELTETQAFLNKQNHIKQAKIDELQARIDKALYHLDFNHDNDKDIAINILKGNKDEN